ncbi:uncharacterized protein WM277_021047 isoform 1-T1 [Molossus nigricans]
MATYPPRRLLGARPLPSDPCRDPRRSGFPQGSGGRWERRLPTGQGWGWVDGFPRVREWPPQPQMHVHALPGTGSTSHHLQRNCSWMKYEAEQIFLQNMHCEPRHPSHIWHLEGPCKLLDVSCPAELMKTWETAQALPSVRHTALPLWRHCDKCPWHEGILQGCLLSDSTRAQAALFLPLLSYVFVQVLC